jgi:hypothetical protein
VVPYSPLWYAGPNAISNAISFAKFNSRSHDAVIHVYDDAGNVIETLEQSGEFREPEALHVKQKPPCGEA